MSSTASIKAKTGFGGSRIVVRVNIIDPSALADQHLIAEYDEILMLLGYIKRYPEIKDGEIPRKYLLGTGHIRFFKDKVLYLKKRHELLKKEMKRRGFATNITINLEEFKAEHKQDWTPDEEDKKIIKERIIAKLNKKPEYYKYEGKNKSLKFFVDKIIKTE
ncbi:MAG: pyrimidine dimer DNA glycosylase/endonuclease V [Candidatus Nanoarchaeia archaeon]